MHKVKSVCKGVHNLLTFIFFNIDHNLVLKSDLHKFEAMFCSSAMSINEVAGPWLPEFLFYDVFYWCNV